MFSIMGLLLYFSPYAQSRGGLGLNASGGGGMAVAAERGPALDGGGARGAGSATTGGMVLIAVAAVAIGTAIIGGGMVLLAIGRRSCGIFRVGAAACGAQVFNALHLSFGSVG
jgi:hypothetical protein